MKDTQNNKESTVRTPRTIETSSVGILNSVNEEFSKDYSSITESLQTQTGFADGTIFKSNPLMIVEREEEIVKIPYNDPIANDKTILRDYLKEERFCFAIKNHVFEQNQNLKEAVKLDCTHLQVILPTLDGGYVSVENPQDLYAGSVGAANYPAFFLGINLQGRVTRDKELQLRKNVALWAIALNETSLFPGDYNGGDPLSATNKEEVVYMGDKCIDAISGCEEAKDWFKRPENNLYCAELGLMALSLGLHYPLTEKFMGEERYAKFKSKIESRDILEGNSNPRIDSVVLELPANSLEPLTIEGEGIDVLGVRPMLASDLLLNHVKYRIDRKTHGSQCGEYQCELLERSLGLLHSSRSYANSPALQEFVKTSVESIKDVFRTDFSSYNEFKEALKPILSKVDKAFATHATASSTFIPPHTFLVRALEFRREGKVKGAVAMEYIGHGFHESFFKGENNE